MTTSEVIGTSVALGSPYVFLTKPADGAAVGNQIPGLLHPGKVLETVEFCLEVLKSVYKVFS